MSAAHALVVKRVGDVAAAQPVGATRDLLCLEVSAAVWFAKVLARSSVGHCEVMAQPVPLTFDTLGSPDSWQRSVDAPAGERDIRGLPAVRSNDRRGLSGPEFVRRLGA